MAELRPGQVFAGHRIERVAGRGGMGVVYAATDLRLKRLVALKVIAPALAAEPNFQQRFERECELAASVDHPGVIPIYSAGEEDGSAYVTMRYVEGTDLARMIHERGRLPPPLVATVARQLGDALAAAHARGLVHRDVKPANVLVRAEGGEHRAFLTDFGLTRELGSDTRLTATGAVIGTVDYMAPEQFADGELDSRTDVYALGCVLYQALTGSVPYPVEGAAAKLYAHSREEPPSLRERAPELSEALERVLRKAMAKAPEDRFGSAADLGAAAAAAIAGDPGQATEALGAPGDGGDSPRSGAATAPIPPGTPPLPPPRRPEPAPPGPPPRRRPGGLAIALGVVAVLTAAAVGYAILGGGDEGGSAGGGRDGDGGGGDGGLSARQVAAIAADVPPGAAANVTAYKRGEIELEGYERRARLVTARDPAVTGRAAEEQALDELILNRWMRGEAAERGLGFSDEAVAAELASPEFAAEAERLRTVGYEEGGVELDATARLAAEAIYGEGTQPVAALTEGLTATNADELADPIAKWRPDTACAADLAELSPLCANGPEPQGAAG